MRRSRLRTQAGWEGQRTATQGERMVGPRCGFPRDSESGRRLGMQVDLVLEDPDFVALCVDRMNQVNTATDVPMLEPCNRGSRINMSVTLKDGSEGLVEK